MAAPVAGGGCGALSRHAPAVAACRRRRALASVAIAAVAGMDAAAACAEFLEAARIPIPAEKRGEFCRLQARAVKLRDPSCAPFASAGLLAPEARADCEAGLSFAAGQPERCARLRSPAARAECAPLADLVAGLHQASACERSPFCLSARGRRQACEAFAQRAARAYCARRGKENLAFEARRRAELERHKKADADYAASSARRDKERAAQSAAALKAAAASESAKSAADRRKIAEEAARERLRAEAAAKEIAAAAAAERVRAEAAAKAQAAAAAREKARVEAAAAKRAREEKAAKQQFKKGQAMQAVPPEVEAVERGEPPRKPGAAKPPKKDSQETPAR